MRTTTLHHTLHWNRFVCTQKRFTYKRKKENIPKFVLRGVSESIEYTSHKMKADFVCFFHVKVKNWLSHDSRLVLVHLLLFAVFVQSSIRMVSEQFFFVLSCECLWFINAMGICEKVRKNELNKATGCWVRLGKFARESFRWPFRCINNFHGFKYYHFFVIFEGHLLSSVCAHASMHSFNGISIGPWQWRT